MKKEMTHKEKQSLKVRRYEQSLKDLQSRIDTMGSNNHLINLEYYYENKIDNLKMRQATKG